MRIIVTGGAGFIGSNLSKSLAEGGHTVLALDSMSSYYSVDLKESRIHSLLSPVGVECKRIALEDSFLVEKIFSDFLPETVIHLAAQPGVRLPLSKTGIYVRDNLDAFSSVLTNVIRQKIPNFLYASSSSIYGNESKLPYSEKEMNLSPVSFYGATKLCNEILTRSLVAGSDTRARGLRLFTVYGPWGRPDMAYFKLAGLRLGSTNFTLNGDGSTLRDFTYIKDVTVMVEALITELSTRTIGYCDVTNIGGGQPRSMDELIGLVLEQDKGKKSFEHKDRNPLDVVSTIADTKYQNELIKTLPSTKLEYGIEEFMRWAREKNIIHKLDSWINSINP